MKWPQTMAIENDDDGDIIALEILSQTRTNDQGMQEHLPLLCCSSGSITRLLACPTNQPNNQTKTNNQVSPADQYFALVDTSRQTDR